LDGAHLGAEEAHAEDVGFLPAHVLGPHVDDALEAQERARGRAGDPVLAGAGLGDDALLSHPPREQRLPERAVDLVRAGVRQVLSLEHHPPKADALCETRRVGERRGTADPLMQEPVELLLECFVGTRRVERRLELGDRGHERLREELTPELSVPAAPAHRRAVPTGGGAELFRIDAMAAISGFGASARMRAGPMGTGAARAGNSGASWTGGLPGWVAGAWHGPGSGGA